MVLFCLVVGEYGLWWWWWWWWWLWWVDFRLGFMVVASGWVSGFWLMVVDGGWVPFIVVVASGGLILG